jgi:hypothetical protein
MDARMAYDFLGEDVLGPFGVLEGDADGLCDLGSYIVEGDNWGLISCAAYIFWKSFILVFRGRKKKEER